MEIFTPQFVLLLTFGILMASIAGRRTDDDKDRLSRRFRPRKSRQAGLQANGSSQESDREPVSFVDFVKSGESASSVRFFMTLPIDILESVDGSLSMNGQLNMKALAKMLRKKPYSVAFEVSCKSRLPVALACIQFLYHVESIDSSRLSAEHNNKTQMAIDRIGINIFTKTNRASA